MSRNDTVSLFCGLSLPVDRVGAAGRPGYPRAPSATVWVIEAGWWLGAPWIGGPASTILLARLVRGLRLLFAKFVYAASNRGSFDFCVVARLMRPSMPLKVWAITRRWPGIPTLLHVGMPTCRDTRNPDCPGPRVTCLSTCLDSWPRRASISQSPATVGRLGRRERFWYPSEVAHLDTVV